MKRIDNILEMYAEIEENKIRAYHQYKKTENIHILKECASDFIDDTIVFIKQVIGESFLPFRLLNAKKNLKTCEDVNVIENFILKVTKENMELKNENITKLKRSHVVADEYGVIESYISIANSIIDGSLNYMCEESSYVIECLENMKIVTEAEGDNTNNTKENIKSTVKKVGAGAKNIGNKVLTAIKELLTKIKNMFKSKIEKLRGRDLNWLKENKKSILSAKVDSIEVNVHEDYKDSLNRMAERSDKFTDELARINFEDPSVNEKLEQKSKQYEDSQGNLRQGLMNFYRTGNPKKVSKVVSLKDSQITSALGSIYDYCISFLNSYTGIVKKINDLEKRIAGIEREMNSRNITENFCYVENDFIENTDLALCENFHLLLENDNGDEPKVGVQQRDKAREEVKGASDRGVSNGNKLLRDQQLGVTVFLTTAEQKYFELIKILRAIV